MRLNCWKIHKKKTKNTTNNMAIESRSHFWSAKETAFLLTQLKELNILNFIDGRKTRNGYLFRKVADQLKAVGFIRSPEQIRVRWKHLKQAYNNAKKKSCTSGHNRVHCPFSDQLEELLGGRSLPHAADHGVDVGFNSGSVADVELEKAAKEEMHPDSVDNDSLSYSTSDGASRTSTPLPDRDRSTSTPKRASNTPPPDLPGKRSRLSVRRRRCQCRDLDLVFQRMEEINHSWRQQLQRSEEREERLVNSVIQSNATMVSALLEGIRSLRPDVVPQPTAPTNPMLSNPSQTQHQSTNSSFIYGYNEYGY